MRSFFVAVLLFGVHLSFCQNRYDPVFKYNRHEIYSLNWFAKDLKTDTVPGISLDLAYDRVLANKPSETVIVAIIDSGVDIDHEDLVDNIWINEDEIAGNKIDDDNNGYIDDIYGWNFLGNDRGENIKNETLELTRIYRKYSGLFGSELENLADQERELFEQVKLEYWERLKRARKEKADLDNFILHYRFYKRYLQAYLKKQVFSLAEVKRINAYDITLSKACEFWIDVSQNGFSEKIISELQENNYSKLNFHLNPEYDPRRDVIGDNIQEASHHVYGNNDVIGDRPSHGTHVAGLIGAIRDNGIGIDGIVENVKIMALRVIPNGDERDKDVANAIRYAVENGARVINMSFSKGYSPQKIAVDNAVRFAEEKGVLIVHGSGNHSKNLDLENVYPNAYYLNNDKAENWLTVGATTINYDKGLAADFSNYGQNNVDLFAPGVDIFSLVNEDGYDFQNGTSMASPIVAGVAALLFSYYPNLTATEVKEIILRNSNELRKMRVRMPGKQVKKNVKFKRLSVTGGIVNAYQAVLSAEKSK